MVSYGIVNIPKARLILFFFSVKRAVSKVLPFSVENIAIVTTPYPLL